MAISLSKSFRERMDLHRRQYKRDVFPRGWRNVTLETVPVPSILCHVIWHLLPQPSIKKVAAESKWFLCALSVALNDADPAFVILLGRTTQLPGSPQKSGWLFVVCRNVYLHSLEEVPALVPMFLQTRLTDCNFLCFAVETTLRICHKNIINW